MQHLLQWLSRHRTGATIQFLDTWRGLRHVRRKAALLQVGSKNLWRDVGWESFHGHGVVGRHAVHVSGFRSGLRNRLRGHRSVRLASVAQLGLHLLQAHHFATGGDGDHRWARLNLLLRDTPDARLRLKVGDVPGIGILLVAGAFGSRFGGMLDMLDGNVCL